MVDGIRGNQPTEYAPPPAIAAKEGQAEGKLTSIGKAFGHLISQLGDKIKNSAPIQQISLLFQAIMLKPEGSEKIPPSLLGKISFLKEKKATQKEIDEYLSKPGVSQHNDKLYQIKQFEKDGEEFFVKKLIGTLVNGRFVKSDASDEPPKRKQTAKENEGAVGVGHNPKVEEDEELINPVKGDFLENLDEFGNDIQGPKDDAATRKAKRQSMGENWGDYS